MAPFYLQRANPSSIKMSGMRKKELALLQRVFNMAAMDIAATRKAMGLRKDEMAAALGIHLSTIYRLESGDIALNRRTALAIEALAKSKRVKVVPSEQDVAA
jgi:DNA-binding transcriptional regulator YiaG